MNIYGIERGLGASYGAKSISDDKVVYGIGVIKVDDEKSYLIQQFLTDDLTDGAPAQAYYVAVQTESVFLLDKDDELSETDDFDDNKTDDGPAKSLKFGPKIVSPAILD